MSSSFTTLTQWIRVASGLRMVTDAIIKQTSTQLSKETSSVARHGCEIVSTGRRAMMLRRMPVPSSMDDGTTDYHQHHPTTMTESTIPTAPKEPPTQLNEGTPIPSTRLTRALTVASLGFRLLASTTYQATTRLVSPTTSIVKNETNANQLVDTLCHMRGAALKLTQMLSLQDSHVLPPPLADILARVRHQANPMPHRQVQSQLSLQLGGSNWKDQYFQTFHDRPFAAASIGQVHYGILRDGITHVAVKVQYPGVADSMDADLRNVSMLLNVGGFLPKGLFMEEILRVGRKELQNECNYELEQSHQRRYQSLLLSQQYQHEDLQHRPLSQLLRHTFSVPSVIEELSTSQILTSTFCQGIPLDQLSSSTSQIERNRIGQAILELTLTELFVWRFMQTDPNFANYLYDDVSGKIHLIDFGATREYSSSFVKGYLRLVWSAANGDVETLMETSKQMGFLTGEEKDCMKQAHQTMGWMIGEPFATYDVYDFRSCDLTARLQEHGTIFLQHRLTPPPEEVYTLHRKLAGMYNLCTRIGAQVSCRNVLESIVMDYGLLLD